MSEEALNPREEATLSSYLRVLRRRWWLLAIPLVLVPAAAVVVSMLQTAKYESSAQVLLSRQNLASALTGTDDPSLLGDAQRYVDTQASIAEVPAIARRALVVADVTDRSVAEYLDQVSVSPRGTTDILEITVTDEDPEVAQRLATAHASEYVAFRTRLDTAALKKAKTEVATRLRKLEAAGQENTPLYQSLQDKEQLLATIDTLQTARATVVRTAEQGKQVSPRPLRNGVLGLFLGVVLGVGLAFLIEALDTRVRNPDHIAQVLGVPLLARLPEPPKKLQKTNRLVMLTQPTSAQAEAFRVLRTNLEFTTIDAQVQTILVTSAVEEEGKSTTVGNLAVALARGGRKVALVDLDLRRPFLDRFFDLGPHPGITNVALGDATLDTALAPIDIATGRSPAAGERISRQPAKGNGSAVMSSEGSRLLLLPSGPPPPNPGEFVESRKVQEILDELQRRADMVLIDAPPLLGIGDAMTLSSLVDGVVLVVELNRVRRGMLNELRRTIDRLPVPILGFVITGVASDVPEYAGYSGYAYRYYTVRPEARPEQPATDADARLKPSKRTAPSRESTDR